METILYSIYRINENRHLLLEDIQNGNVYKFNRYNEIIDEFANTDSPLFSNRERVEMPSSPIKIVNIHRYTYEKEYPDDVDIGDEYYWSDPLQILKGPRHFLIRHLLETLHDEPKYQRALALR